MNWFAFCAAIPISRVHAEPTRMLKYKIRQAPTADFTTNLVFVNLGGIIPQGPAPVITSLLYPQKFSRKILSEQYKYQTSLKITLMLLIYVKDTHLLI